MRRVLFIVFRLLVRACDAIYGGEGINIAFAAMPTSLIAGVLRGYGAGVGERVRFRAPLTIHNSATGTPRYYGNLVVGDDCYFGRELFLDLQDRIVVEDHVTISHRVMILTHTDAGESPLRASRVPTSQAAVIIRSGAYIGAHATILQGVEIGAGAVIGAGALVCRSVPPHSVAVGVPARVVEGGPETGLRRQETRGAGEGVKG